MVNLQEWRSIYQQIVLDLFGERVLFIGLQGSYARNEAARNSDLDVVLILDKLDFNDLTLYKEALDHLPHRPLLCGFVSGRQELLNWCKFDLFQFYHDTISWYGSFSQTNT